MRFAAALIAILAGASSIRAVEIWSASELKSSAENLVPEAQAKGIAGTALGAATLWRRAKSGQAEFHKTKTDLLIIEAGSATLVFGGTIPDGRATAPGEIRGSTIRGGESRKVGPGDVIRIPAATPHQFVLDKGQTVAYFALKLAR